MSLEPTLDGTYWRQRYQMNTLGWDIGYANSALLAPLELLDRSTRILVPGAGRAWEVERLFGWGFADVFALDVAPEARDAFLKRVPEFPEEQYLIGDFFDHIGTYDRIVEQTFFCALRPELRRDYGIKMGELLSSGGILSGLLFDFPLDGHGPPFGGSQEEYRELFAAQPEVWAGFLVEKATEGIPQRLGREFRFEARRL